jgi:hypothetical protein
MNAPTVHSTDTLYVVQLRLLDGAWRNLAHRREVTQELARMALTEMERHGSHRVRVIKRTVTIEPVDWAELEVALP